MFAIIKEHLVRPTRNGFTIVRKYIEGETVARCSNSAQDYILKRIFDESRIPVEYFEVEVRRAKRKDSKIFYSWTYKPTYRA